MAPTKQNSQEARLLGDTLAGRYRIVKRLGDGGMGAVYKAADVVLRRFVAVKVLHKSVASNPQSVERFEREARAAAQIGHPNICEVLDFGSDGGAPFMVMEYLRGHALSSVLATDGPLPIPRAVSIATHTLAGLVAAHDRGILHRDLKPANLMLVSQLGDRDFVKVCDFGFAALLQPDRIEDKTLTPERTLVGTPAYASPERLKGNEKKDARIDVYSMGVVLFEMLAGRRPFEAATFVELARKIRFEPAPKLRTLRADVPAGLELVLDRALAKEPEDRWESAEQLAQALIPFGGRAVRFESEDPSDSFSLDLFLLKARETKQRRSSVLPPRASEPGRVTTDRIVMPEMRHTDAQRTDVRASPLEIPIDVEDLEQPSADRTAPHPAVRDESVQVRGALVLPVLRFVARKFGEKSLGTLLSSLPDDVRGYFESGISPDAFVPGYALRALVEQIDAQLGQDDLRMVMECGRAAAEGLFDRVRQVQLPSPPPELVLAELSTLTREVLGGIEVHVRRVGRGYGRVELAETGEPSLIAGVMLLGILDRLLSRFGANEVEVQMATSRALGDELTSYEITWLVT